MGAIFWMAGCEACCPKPCKTEAKPVCASYKCTSNGSWRQRDGSSWKESRCSICGTQKTSYTKNGKTYTKCPKCTK
jgi:hypothetical protein